MNPKSNLNVAGACCLFVNGLIFVFYAVSVPGFIKGVHWLITLAAVLFIVALPAIYRSLGRVHKSAVRLITAAFGVGMVLIVVSDVLLVSSLLSKLTHDLFYAFGNALFVISLFAIGLLSWKEKWLGIFSLVTGIVGVLTYIPGALLLFVPSLLLLGLWSFAMGFVLRRPK